jgi:hypothetical protein
MKPSFRSRMKRLEARTKASEPLMLRTGFLTQLPEDFTGERHVVVLKREPAGSPHQEWCDFEERPGPAPPGSDDGGLTIYLTR